MTFTEYMNGGKETEEERNVNCIEIEKFSFLYPQQTVPALAGVDMTVEEGSLLCCAEKADAEKVHF